MSAIAVLQIKTKKGHNTRLQYDFLDRFLEMRARWSLVRLFTVNTVVHRSTGSLFLGLHLLAGSLFLGNDLLAGSVFPNLQ